MIKQSLLAVVTLLILSATAPHAGEGGPSRPIPAVSVAQASVVASTQPKTFIGTVKGREQVDITARVSGTLQKANFQEGGLVKAGDVLFEIEDTVYAANVRIAEAVIAQSEADLELAIKEHERSTRLLESKAIAAQSFDSTLATMNLKRAKLEEAKANLVLARHDLDHCRIVSPISGRIGEKSFSEGNYITPSVGILATVVQYQPIKVQFSMSESDFFRLFRTFGKADNIALEVIRANGEPYRGEIRTAFVDNIVDRHTDTIMVSLECDNDGYQLIPGGYVQVRLSEKFDKPMTAISLSAVMMDGKRHYVYVVKDDGAAEARDIVIGDLVYNMQTVKSGLTPGETVVVGGLNKVTPGGKVNPVPVATQN